MLWHECFFVRDAYMCVYALSVHALYTRWCALRTSHARVHQSWPEHILVLSILQQVLHTNATLEACMPQNYLYACMSVDRIRWHVSCTSYYSCVYTTEFSTAPPDQLIHTIYEYNCVKPFARRWIDTRKNVLRNGRSVIACGKATLTFNQRSPFMKPYLITCGKLPK